MDNMEDSKNSFRDFAKMDRSILNRLNQAIKNNERTPITKETHGSIKRVLTIFVKAMEHYIMYGQTHARDYYEKSMISFAKVPFLERIKLSEDFMVLLIAVQKITNIIRINYQDFYMPPKEVFEKMTLLVQMFRSTRNTGLTIKGHNAVTDPKQTKTTLTTSCREILKSKESLQGTVENQMEKSRMTSNAAETVLRNDLRETLATVYPNHELHIFGSRVSGQALDDSDLDFYCDVSGESYHTLMPIGKQRSHVKVVEELVKQKHAIFKEVLPVPKARVPIVKLVHKPTHINCGIGFRDGSGVENTKLLKLYLDVDSSVRWVCTAVKLWADVNDIKNNRYFRSHGLTWLVLFYLMTKKLVPPFKELQKNCEPKLINGWNAAFTDPKDSCVPDTEDSPLELFKGFFSWVVTADLTANVLSPYTGELIPKKSFKKMTWLKKKAKLRLNGNSGLCIHDAIEHGQNIVSDMKDLLYSNFIEMCSETLDILDEH